MKNRAESGDLLALVERRNEELETLVEIGKALTSSLDLREILSIIMEKVSLLLKPETWSLLLLDEATGDLTFEIAVSPAAERLKGIRLRKGQGIAGWVALHGEPLLIPDAREDERFAAQVDEAVDFRTRSIVCVPVKSKNRILGVVELVNSLDEGQFDEADLKILATIADYAAIAIENARYFAKVRELVITDDLSGLYNARYLLEFLDYEIDRARRYGTDLSLVFLDLDYFKDVNDTYGHLAGSGLLSEMGRLIQKHIRKADIAARYGGDEFVVVLPNTSKAGAHTMATNLHRVVKDHYFLVNEGYRVRITASFGVASYPADAQTKLALIRMADKAMYDVKDSTRDAVKLA
ncbi:MAG: sensor domain-containing diguanylate cyclase [Deltaproteobacteria bacterium]|nr:sensor domain-containing diguanylate cyclase [Deltaproteobacteria bacterium]